MPSSTNHVGGVEGQGVVATTEGISGKDDWDSSSQIVTHQDKDGIVKWGGIPEILREVVRVVTNIDAFRVSVEHEGENGRGVLGSVDNCAGTVSSIGCSTPTNGGKDVSMVRSVIMPEAGLTHNIGE